MARKSTEQMINESNAWAAEQNRKSNYGGKNYMMNQYDPKTGGYHSMEDPARRAFFDKANLAGTGSFGKPMAKGATYWSSADPNRAFYSPTGTGRRLPRGCWGILT
jgi:hypothetical protein